MTQATAPAIDTDPLVVAIVSVSLTLVVGIVVGLVTALLSRRGEHAKWVRERRFDAYVAFMIDMEAVTTLHGAAITAVNASKMAARAESIVERVPAAFEAVSLLGPRSVNAAGQNWVWAIVAYGQDKSDLRKADVSQARWDFLVSAGKVLKSKNVGLTPLSKPDSKVNELAFAFSKQ